MWAATREPHTMNDASARSFAPGGVWAAEAMPLILGTSISMARLPGDVANWVR